MPPLGAKSGTGVQPPSSVGHRVLVKARAAARISGCPTRIERDSSGIRVRPGQGHPVAWSDFICAGRCRRWHRGWCLSGVSCAPRWSVGARFARLAACVSLPVNRGLGRSELMRSAWLLEGWSSVGANTLNTHSSGPPHLCRRLTPALSVLPERTSDVARPVKAAETLLGVLLHRGWAERKL